MGWSRSSGPPRIWREVELVNSAGKKFQFTIQEIPANRYSEALDHMCANYLNDEPVASCLKLSEDPEAVKAMRNFWNHILQQGVSIGAFEKNAKNKEPILAGMNILVVIDEESYKKLKAIPVTYEKMKKFFDLQYDFVDEGDPRRVFNVDLYLSGFGLSVGREYRKLGLSNQLLDTRHEIVRAYNIPASGTIFSSPLSQKAAAAAGFTDVIVRDYDDILNDEGEKYFPSLTGKQIKYMVKQFV